MRRFETIRAKFIVLLASVIVVMLGTNMLWQHYASEQSTERELLDQARALSSNMDAVWTFMTRNQDLINYDSAGNYEFKGLQCSIAGRSIGALFSRVTDYGTSYVALSPRNDYDYPDEFEASGLTAFAQNAQANEYYGYDEIDGHSYFRYLHRMNMEETCLDCHGEPAGELDMTGYPREGLHEGDLYGAISLAIPVDAYQQASRTSMMQTIALSALMILACMAVIWLALSRLVTQPIDRVRKGMERFEKGNRDTRVVLEDTTREMKLLTRGFNSMADELQESHESLEMKVEERTSRLSEANEELAAQQAKLEEANGRLADESQYKSDFLAMMSHELKTPLAASMAFSRILKERQGEPSDEDAQLWAELEANNRSLLVLIESILQMARIEAGKETLNLELIDLVDVLGPLQATIEPLASDKGIVLEWDIADDMPLLFADGEKLRRVFENLTSNALKFTESGGRIAVRCQSLVAQSAIEFRITDTGIGISAADAARIFEKFTQADGSISRSYGGSGLGLAMCKELVEMHGGTIAVESEPGAGSTFTVRIPANLQPPVEKGE